VKPIRELFDGWKAATANKKHERASRIRTLIASYPLIAAVKATLAEQHRHRGWQRVRPPLVKLDDQQASELRDKLAGLAAA
jgi:4-hydroxy-tetrahydrodipicolinate synthase